MSSRTAAVAEAPGGITVEEVMRSALTTVEREAHLAAAFHCRDSGDRPRPLSVITNTDIARAVADGMDVNAIRISDLADRPVVVAHPDLAVAEAAEIMLDTDVRQLPVVRDGTLVGVLEMADACRAMLGHRSKPADAVLTQPPQTSAAHT